MAETYKTSTASNTKSIAIITNGCVLQGDISLTGPIHINGKIEGNITTSSQVLIGAKGVVAGCITAKHLIIKGKLQGEAKTEFFEALAGGIAKGSVTTHIMTCERGAKLDLITSMEQKKHV